MITVYRYLLSRVFLFIFTENGEYMTNFLTYTHRKCPFSPFGCHGDDDIVFIIFQIQPSTVSGMQICLQANNILGIRREPGRPAAAG